MFTFSITSETLSKPCKTSKMFDVLPGFWIHLPTSQLTVTSSKPAIKPLEKGKTYVQSL